MTDEQDTSGAEPTQASQTSSADSADSADSPSRTALDAPSSPRMSAGKRVAAAILQPGTAAFLLGFIALFLQMAAPAQLPHGGLVGALSALLMVGGLLHAMGLLRPTTSDTPLRMTSFGPLPGEPVWQSPLVTLPVALVIAVLGTLAMSHTPGGFSPVLVCALLVAAVSAFRRPAMLPLLILSLIYLPRLGSFALWDPWETHYGEVAREMLSRNDWISPWWAQEEWFWSKPVLIFWSEAWSMSALGVSALPDSHPLHPEWALRLPIFAMSMFAIAAIQAFAGRAFGRRAGILAALVVGTMPHFYLLAHQAITDMPLTASLTVAVCLLGLALLEREDTVSGRIRVGPFGIDLRTVAMGTVLLMALPPLIYLLSRNVDFVPARGGFAFHLDEFIRGSAGNDGVSGNVAVTPMSPVYANPQPVVQGLIWLLALAGTCVLVYRSRSRRDTYLVGFYLACAVGLLGKGIPGFALPGLVAMFYLVASRRWSLLLDGKLRVGLGALIITTVGMPWYVAMYVRHGRAFVDRILIHDHLNRLASGVHGDNGPIDYFLAQLGYGTFPFVGLIPIAIFAFAWLPRRPREVDGLDTNREASILVALWAMAGFTLFNAMVTKFHHYIFPVVPPAGFLVGVLLDRMLGTDSASNDSPSRARRVAWFALAGVGATALLAAVAGAYGDPRGVIPAGVSNPDWVTQHAYPTWVVVALAAIGLVSIAGSVRLAGTSIEGSRPVTPTERGLGVAMFGAAVLMAFVGRDLSWVLPSHPFGYERFIHLFIYLYNRPWPDYLDYRPVFTAATVVATLAVGLMAFRRLRVTAVAILLTTSIALATFSVNLYLPDLAEHWSTHGLIDRYYAQRHGREPLIAFQMNWKGENFYTGNRVQVFQDVDTAIIRHWLDTHRGATIFALSEHTRIESLRMLLPAGSRLQRRSTLRDNNKFGLVRIVIAPPERPPAHVD